MFWIIRYFLGFVKIEFCGELCEQIINMAHKNKIPLWNLKYKKRKITAYISAKNFKKMPLIHRKTRVKIKILEKYGIPFLINKHKKRSGLLFGFIIFMSSLYFLSIFVWTVNVLGNENISDSEIINSCRKIGVYEGVTKTSFDTKDAAQSLLLINEGLAWASFNLEGSVLNVNVTETVNIKEKGEDLPSNIIADYDGIVKKIDAKSGNVVVKVGDAVAKGDVLVSGVMERLNSTLFVRSKGEVFAETNLTFSAEKSFEDTVEYKTGRVIRKNTLEIFSLKIPFGFQKVKGEHIKEEKFNRLVILGRNLPVATKKTTYYFTDKKKVSYTKEKIKDSLIKEIEEKIKKEGVKEYELRSEEFIETDEKITYKKQIAVIKNIAKEQKIRVDNKTE